MSVSQPESVVFCPRLIQDRDTGTEIQVLDEECYLIRNLLGPEEQTRLFQYIQQRDKTPWDTLPRPMVPSPKTLLFGENQPTIKFAFGEKSAVSTMVGKASQMLDRNQLGSGGGVNLGQYASLSMACIQYESPDGHFPPHIDHSNSFVFLLSLGCTANFMVKGPNMEARNNFKFHSGDMLVFNASTKAKILHGVMNIDGEETCPGWLATQFPVLKNHRYGVQCRMHF